MATASEGVPLLQPGEAAFAKPYVPAMSIQRALQAIADGRAEVVPAGALAEARAEADLWRGRYESAIASCQFALDDMVNGVIRDAGRIEIFNQVNNAALTTGAVNNG